jgi:hypothetical protein
MKVSQGKPNQCLSLPKRAKLQKPLEGTKAQRLGFYNAREFCKGYFYYKSEILATRMVTNEIKYLLQMVFVVMAIYESTPHSFQFRCHSHFLHV